MMLAPLKCDRLQRRAIKRILPDARDGGGNRQFSDAALTEGAFADVRQSVRKRQLRDAGAAVKGFVADTRDGVRDRHVRNSAVA